MAMRSVEALGDLLVPDAVLRLFAAGVGLLTVAVAETGIEPQGDASARRMLAELVDHVGRTAIDVDVVFDAQADRFSIKNVGRIDDRRGIATGGIAGGQGPAYFTGADGVDQGALAANQIDHGDVRAGLLRIANDVEGR